MVKEHSHETETFKTKMMHPIQLRKCLEDDVFYVDDEYRSFEKANESRTTSS